MDESFGFTGGRTCGSNIFRAAITYEEGHLLTFLCVLKPTSSFLSPRLPNMLLGLCQFFQLSSPFLIIAHYTFGLPHLCTLDPHISSPFLTKLTKRSTIPDVHNKRNDCSRPGTRKRRTWRTYRYLYECMEKACTFVVATENGKFWWTW